MDITRPEIAYTLAKDVAAHDLHVGDVIIRDGLAEEVLSITPAEAPCVVAEFTYHVIGGTPSNVCRGFFGKNATFEMVAVKV